MSGADQLPSVDAEAFADIQWAIPDAAPIPAARASAAKPRVVKNAPSEIVRKFYSPSDGEAGKGGDAAAASKRGGDEPASETKRRRVSQ